MASYRLYFYEGNHQISGQYDLEAEDDSDALIIADALGRAYHDRCHFIEVWAGKRLVGNRSNFSDVTLDDLIASRQKRMIRHEMAISESKWAITQSQKLMERIDALIEQGVA